MRNSRCKEIRGKSPKKYLSGYDAAHILAEEYNSAKKEKQERSLRRDASQDSLVNYNAQESAVKASPKPEPISPFSPSKTQPMSKKRVSYDENIEQHHPVVRKLEMKYYDSRNPFKKPLVEASPSEELSSNPSRLGKPEPRLPKEEETSNYAREYSSLK